MDPTELESVTFAMRMCCHEMANALERNARRNYFVDGTGFELVTFTMSM